MFTWPFCWKETLFYVAAFACVFLLLFFSWNYKFILSWYMYGRDEGLSHLYTQADQTSNAITVFHKNMLLATVLPF